MNTRSLVASEHSGSPWGRRVGRVSGRGDEAEAGAGGQWSSTSVLQDASARS